MKVREFLRSTPVELTLRRWHAYLVDAIVVAIVGALVRLAVRDAPDLSIEIVLAIGIEGVVLARLGGSTVGRRLFRLRVSTSSVLAVGLRAVGRWIPLYATGLTISYSADLAVGQVVFMAAMLWGVTVPLTRGARSVHDWLASTEVQWTDSPVRSSPGA